MSAQPPRRPPGASPWPPIFASAGLASLLGFLALAEFRMGPLVAGLVAVGGYFAIHAGIERMRARRRARFGPAPGEVEVADGPIDPLVDLLAGAERDARRLDAAAATAGIKTRTTLAALAGHARAVAAAVTADPDKLAPVLRLFTYYLPAAADLAEDRMRHGPKAGAARLAEIDATLARLVAAFAGFERTALEPDLRDIDLDLRLIDQALAEDGAVLAGPAADDGTRARRDRSG